MFNKTEFPNVTRLDMLDETRYDYYQELALDVLDHWGDTDNMENEVALALYDAINVIRALKNNDIMETVKTMAYTIIEDVIKELAEKRKHD